MPSADRRWPYPNAYNDPDIHSWRRKQRRDVRLAYRHSRDGSGIGCRTALAGDGDLSPGLVNLRAVFLDNRYHADLRNRVRVWPFAGGAFTKKAASRFRGGLLSCLLNTTVQCRYLASPPPVCHVQRRFHGNFDSRFRDCLTSPTETQPQESNRSLVRQLAFE